MGFGINRTPAPCKCLNEDNVSNSRRDFTQGDGALILTDGFCGSQLGFLKSSLEHIRSTYLLARRCVELVASCSGGIARVELDGGGEGDTDLPNDEGDHPNNE